MQNKNVLTNILVVVIVLVLGVLIGLFISNKDSAKNRNIENNQIVTDGKIQNSISTNIVEKKSLPETVSNDNLSKTCVEQTDGNGIPVITSIFPSSGPVGTPIEVKGCNLNGFEGDLILQIKNADGVTAVIYGQGQSIPIETKRILTKIPAQSCKKDMSYIGAPCEEADIVNLLPGTYKIYTIPWGKKSNEVTFTITESKDLSAGSGYKRYADTSFDYAFYYPDNWIISNISDGISISNIGPQKNNPDSDTITIKKVVGGKVVVNDAKFGNTTLYFDKNTQTWMQNMTDLSCDCYKLKPAVSTNTLSGLPYFTSTGRWLTRIIALSDSKFLVANITGSGDTRPLDPLVANITNVKSTISPESILISERAVGAAPLAITDGSTEIGIIQEAYISNGKKYINIDYIQWLSRDQCLGKGLEAPDGYCLVNDNPLVRTFEVSNSAKISLSPNIDNNYKGNVISFDILKKNIESSPDYEFINLYNIKISNNIVTEITEPYRP